MDGKYFIPPLEVIADMGPIRCIDRCAAHNLNGLDRGPMRLLLEGKETKDLITIGKAGDDRNDLCGMNKCFGQAHGTLQIAPMFFNKTRRVVGEGPQRDEYRVILLLSESALGKVLEPLTLVDE